MSENTSGDYMDPVILQPPAMPQAPGHPKPEREKAAEQWVVVEHVGGEGAKSHLDHARRQLENAGISAREAHDDSGRPVLEVRESDVHEARRVLKDQANGNNHAAHETREQRIEEQEKAELTGPFKLQYIGWFVIGLVIIFALFIIYSWVF